MNFLAHLYLAKNVEGKIGNFIADAIKGRKYEHLPLGVQKGIIHHRAIDTFTDSHAIVKQSKRRLDPKYRHFKAVIIDIIYDHFLAKNWQQYSATPLHNFTQDTYQLLEDHYEILPERTQYLLPFMKEQNWLYNYRSIEGISQILWGMNKRTKGISQMDLAKIDLVEHYEDFEKDFELFFKELIVFSKEFKS
ncbi:acyl carrier protein phosphodiesterase [Flavicella sediminum]|uniref:acyl carrier protein phosphodiesterase n=1 Tax=Flavicella sediminum TaxID=2585141 RepID=UPI001121BC98|nr:acyl carrier protein phosphodiesterase [Flavicella sediminum]